MTHSDERHARMTAGADAVLGLAGAVALEAPCDGRRYCYPSVVSALERGELECAAFPPWPAPAGAGPHMGNASCQTLSFAVAVAGVDNSRLLSEAPALTLGRRAHVCSCAVREWGRGSRDDHH